MSGRFAGRVGVIVGATGGIGGAVARLLAAEGAQLVLVARREAELTALATELGALAVAGDAREAATSEAAVARAVEAHGGLDFAVHAVGTIMLKPLARLTPADLLAAFQLDVLSAFHLLRAALGPLERRGGGSVVACSSVAAATGLPNHEAVAMAKGALEGMLRAAAMTYAPAGIRFNAVAPGLTRTPLAGPLLRTEAARATSEKVHPLGRIIEPVEVATAIAYLLAAPNVTGTVLPVDGGIAGGRLMR
jgi:NAD(P)-dependent dehydrogenase (short-subunit alcohol dehydrogenase family)